MSTEIILSIVVAIATSIYTIVTIFQLIESRKVRFQKDAPNIVAFLKSAEDHVVMELYIENFGEGVAKDVKIEILKDFNPLNEENQYLAKKGIVKNGMNFFPPKYKQKFYIGSMTTLYQKHLNDKVTLKITYKNLNNHSFNHTFELPFNQIFGQNYSNPPETYMGKIPYYLNEISKQLELLNK